jgi:hypothetical protein
MLRSSARISRNARLLVRQTRRYCCDTGIRTESAEGWGKPVWTRAAYFPCNKYCSVRRRWSVRTRASAISYALTVLTGCRARGGRASGGQAKIVLQADTACSRRTQRVPGGHSVLQADTACFRRTQRAPGGHSVLQADSKVIRVYLAREWDKNIKFMRVTQVHYLQILPRSFFHKWDESMYLLHYAEKKS